MDFLVIGGVVVRVVSTGAAEREPFIVGESSRADDGTLMSSVRGEKGEWQFTTVPLLPSEHAALRGAIGPSGSLVTCSGSALGRTVLCEVTITGSTYEHKKLASSEGVGFKRIVSLRLREA